MAMQFVYVSHLRYGIAGLLQLGEPFGRPSDSNKPLRGYVVVYLFRLGECRMHKRWTLGRNSRYMHHNRTSKCQSVQDDAQLVFLHDIIITGSEVRRIYRFRISVQSEHDAPRHRISKKTIVGRYVLRAKSSRPQKQCVRLRSTTIRTRELLH